MKVIKYVIFSCILMVFLSSCEEKGCTNPDAVNYDITANEDDGSCIVCQNSTTLYDSMDIPLVDKKPSSIYYNDTVGIFHLVQYIENPSDKVCGEATSYIEMNLQNLVNQNMQLDFNMEDVLGPLNFYYGRLANVSASDSYDFGTIFNINFPPFYKISQDSIRVTLSGYIQYY